LPAAGRRNIAAFSVGNQGYVVGGFQDGSNVDHAEVWRYNPLTNSWTQMNNFVNARNGVTCFVINDTAYAGLGAYGSTYYNDFYRYDAAGDQWIPVASFPGGARYLAMAFSIGGKGYVGCGFSGGQHNDFYEYDPASNTWTVKASFPGSSREAGLGISIGNYGIMGWGYNGPSLTDAYLYNPSTNTWSAIGALNSGGRNGPASFVINDTVYAGAGTNGSTYYADLWRYDMSGNNWIQVKGFNCIAQGRMSAMGGWSINGYGYIPLGGVIGGTSDFNDLLEFGPPDTTFATKTNFLGNDTTYCGNFTRVLSTGDTCTVWSTGFIGSQITVSIAGTYWAYYDNGCGISIDTIHFAQAATPIVNLGNDTTVCVSQSVQLNAANVGASYTWSTGAHTQIIYASQPGVYSVTVTANGCHSSASVQISSDSIALATNEVKISCGANNGEANVLVYSGNTPFKYAWNNNDTTSSITNLAAGNYLVTVTDAIGCSSTAGIAVASASLPVITLPTDTTVCSSSFPILLQTGATDSTYRWSNNATTAGITVASSGFYSVTVSNGPGCTATGSITVNSDALNISTNQINASCNLSNGEAIVQASSASSGITYHWNNGSSADSVPNLGAGVYSVTVKDAANCSAMASLNIVSTGIQPVTIAAAQTTICPGDTASICATAGFLSYSWSNGDTSMCIHTPDAGNYYVTASQGANCSVTSNEVTINVRVPQPVTISVAGDTLTCYPSVSYQWYLNGNILPGDTFNVIIASQPGTYDVRVLDINGCFDNSSPVTTALNELADNNVFVLYPNPTSNSIYIKLFPEPVSASTYYVISASGSIITSGKILDSNIALSTDYLSAGTYSLKVMDAAGNSTSKRFEVLRAK
jgi:N-acetylneuraminic acid mutarotase